MSQAIPPDAAVALAPRWHTWVLWALSFGAIISLFIVAVSCSAQNPAAPGGGITRTSTVTPTPVNRQAVSVAVDAGPNALLFDDRGRLWVVSSEANSVSRLAKDNSEVEFTIPVPGNPQRAAWWGGTLWVSVRDEGKLVAVDPEQERVVSQIVVGENPTEVVEAFGSLWVLTAPNPHTSHLVQVDPQTRERQGYVTLAGDAQRVAVGGDALWVTHGGEVASVDVVDPQRVGNSNRRFQPVTHLGTIPECSQARGMLVRDGQLWIACMGSQRVVGLDERTGEVVKRVKLPGNPQSLTHATNADMWAYLRDSHSFALVDPRGAKLNATWHLTSGPSPTPMPSPIAADRPEYPVDMVLMQQRVWFTSRTPARVYGIDVRPLE